MRTHKKTKKKFPARLYLGIAIAVLALIYLISSGKVSLPRFLSGSGSQTFAVNITDERFSPNPLTIKAGDTVRFENKSSRPAWPASDPHPTHDFYPGFDPLREIKPGASWEFVFTKVGDWTYHDHLSPHRRGEIIVTEAAGGSSNLNGPPPEIAALRAEADPKKQAEIVHAMAEKYGPKTALNYMKVAGLPYTGETHLLVHEIGNVAYERYGDKALLYCDESFLSACYHGVVLHALGDHGMDGVAALMKQCEAAGPSVLAQCSHAAGHGFLAYNDYRVLAALPLCDKLKDLFPDVPTFNCNDGVFMENIFGVHGGKPSPNRMLKDDDKYYPCDAVPDKYRPGCWADQATRMYQMFGGDLKKVAEGCDGVDNAEYKRICYNNFSRQIHPLTQGKIESALAMCKNATGTYWQDECLITLVDAAFSVGDKKNLPYGLCAALKNSPRESECYDHVLANISSFSQGPDDTALMCGLIQNESKRNECAQRFRVTPSPNSSLPPNSSPAATADIQKIENIAKESGAAAAYKYLRDNWLTNPVAAHDLAHVVGRLAYDEMGAKGISICDMNFAFGCYHGFFEVLIKKSGNKGIEDGRTSCEGLSLPGPTASCLHGIGHGIMGTALSVKQALGKCDSFPAGERAYCFDGAYMEYFTGVMQNDAAKTLSVSADKPWDFCLGMPAESEGQCVRNETMFLLYAKQAAPASVAQDCGALDADLKGQCVNSFGLFATQQSQGNSQAIKDICANFKNSDDESFCVAAAAGELIFEGRDATLAHDLCSGLESGGKKLCEDRVSGIEKEYGVRR